MNWRSRLWESIKAMTKRERGFKLSARSLKALEGVHPDLQRVVNKAITITEVDFIVTEGRRTLERQRQLVARGASRTLNSRHITGHAVDVVAFVDGKVTYNFEHMKKISEAMKEAANELLVPIVWGGDWKTFKDTPHFELDRSSYP